jgi:GrpB-like predicted nucleotidyltransferase (UPF0157 family)
MAERVAVIPYDPEWPHRFDQERAIVDAVFAGSDAPIEHIGSTAVPGLGAKPVIDMMIGLGTLEDAERRIAALEAAGYEYVREYESQVPERRYFRKPRIGPREYHLHCVLKGSSFWVRHLAFRDYLRAHPESAADYYQLKRDLAVRFTKDEYTKAKTRFIEGILTSAIGDRDRRAAQQ